MKQSLFVLVLFACFANMSNAQSLKDAQVPAPVKAAFEKQYPKTTAKWEKEKANYEVNFKKDGKSMSAVIDPAGSILETETDIPVAELPASVATYLKAHYAGAKVKEAAKIVKANGEVTYESEVNGKDVMFDANGKFLKEAKD